MLVLYPGLPAQDLARADRARQGEAGALNYGSAGVAIARASGDRAVREHGGRELTHVPYKSSAQSMTDMITGRLDMQFATIAPSLPNIRAGNCARW